MINEPPPLKGLNIRIPIISPIKGRGFANQGSTLGFRGLGLKLGKKMEATVVCWGYIRIMEKKMETTTVYWG